MQINFSQLYFHDVPFNPVIEIKNQYCFMF